jgi:hypothetical protein
VDGWIARGCSKIPDEFILTTSISPSLVASVLETITYPLSLVCLIEMPSSFVPE